MRIECPYCGRRDQGEFIYLGDAGKQRPEPAAGEAAMFDYVYLRQNPAGWLRELWYHGTGCRAWLVVTRNVVTHEIREVTAAAGAGASTEAAE